MRGGFLQLKEWATAGSESYLVAAVAMGDRNCWQRHTMSISEETSGIQLNITLLPLVVGSLCYLANTLYLLSLYHQAFLPQEPRSVSCRQVSACLITYLGMIGSELEIREALKGGSLARRIRTAS